MDNKTESGIFVKEVAKYFMNFLETDFKKRRIPKRDTNRKTKSELTVGLDFEKYPKFKELLVKNLNIGFEKPELSVRKGEFVVNIPESVFKYIDIKIGDISESLLSDFFDAILKIFTDNKLLYSQEYDKIEENSLGEIKDQLKNIFINPLLEELKKPLENLNLGDDTIFNLEGEIIDYIFFDYESRLKDVLLQYITNDTNFSENELKNIFILDEIKEKLSEFFNNFSVKDLFAEIYEIYKNNNLIDKTELYLYFYEIGVGSDKFPLFYTPIAIERIESSIKIQFDKRLFVNTACIEYVVQEYNREMKSASTLNGNFDRIIYLNAEENFKKRLEDLLLNIEHFFGLSTQIDIDKSLLQKSIGSIVSLSNKVHLYLFDKSDEALINDYEEILNLDSTLLGDFNSLLEDFITVEKSDSEDKKIIREVDDEWDSMDTCSKLMYESPIPLNDEQKQVINALDRDDCRFLILEGPPGTGKSHTITSIICKALLEEKSILVLSDKKEALDVVEDKISSTLNKVRFDEGNFQNPILRIGKAGAKFHKLIQAQMIGKIKEHARSFRTNKTNFDKYKDNTKLAIYEDLSKNIAHYTSISLNEVETYFSNIEKFQDIPWINDENIGYISTIEENILGIKTIISRLISIKKLNIYYFQISNELLLHFQNLLQLIRLIEDRKSKNHYFLSIKGNIYPEVSGSDLDKIYRIVFSLKEDLTTFDLTSNEDCVFNVINDYIKFQVIINDSILNLNRITGNGSVFNIIKLMNFNLGITEIRNKIDFFIKEYQVISNKNKEHEGIIKTANKDKIDFYDLVNNFIKRNQQSSVRLVYICNKVIDFTFPIPEIIGTFDIFERNISNLESEAKISIEKIQETFNSELKLYEKLDEYIKNKKLNPSLLVHFKLIDYSEFNSALSFLGNYILELKKSKNLVFGYLFNRSKIDSLNLNLRTLFYNFNIENPETKSKELQLIYELLLFIQKLNIHQNNNDSFYEEVFRRLTNNLYSHDSINDELQIGINSIQQKKVLQYNDELHILYPILKKKDDFNFSVDNYEDLYLDLTSTYQFIKFLQEIISQRRFENYDIQEICSNLLVNDLQDKIATELSLDLQKLNEKSSLAYENNYKTISHLFYEKISTIYYVDGIGEMKLINDFLKGEVFNDDKYGRIILRIISKIEDGDISLEEIGGILNKINSLIEITQNTSIDFLEISNSYLESLKEYHEIMLELEVASDLSSKIINATQGGMILDFFTDSQYLYSYFDLIELSKIIDELELVISMENDINLILSVGSHIPSFIDHLLPDLNSVILTDLYSIFPEYDDELIMEYISFKALENKIKLQFNDLPKDNYYSLSSDLETIITTEMANFIDERLIDYVENNPQEVNTLKNIVSQKLKFPKELFRNLKKAFPCIIAGIRDYADYIPLEKDLFDLIIIDEASQVSIAQALPAFIRGKKIVILGDDKQFSNVKSNNAKKEINNEYKSRLRQTFKDEFIQGEDVYGLLTKIDENFDIKNSVLKFTRFIRDYEIQLKKHFRCYPEIISYSNKYFYGNSLQCMKIRAKPIEEVIKFEFIEHDGLLDLKANTNQLEVDFIISKLLEFKESGIKQSVGIITPHTEQASLLAVKIGNLEDHEYYFNDLKLKIMTFDTCQGEERDYIFYSMVASESKDRLAWIFLKSFATQNEESEGTIRAQRMNVGFSRAKETIHFVLSQPLEKFNGEIGNALVHYKNELENGKKRIIGQTDVNSPMEEKIQHYFYETSFYKNYQDKIELIPQFPIGEYIKQLDKQYKHPLFKVDFLLIYENQKIVIEYDGFKEHFTDRENITQHNYEFYMKEDDIYRQKVLEGYGYQFLRINIFNIGKNPVETLNARLENLVKKN